MGDREDGTDIERRTIGRGLIEQAHEGLGPLHNARRLVRSFDRGGKTKAIESPTLRIVPFNAAIIHADPSLLTDPRGLDPPLPALVAREQRGGAAIWKSEVQRHGTGKPRERLARAVGRASVAHRDIGRVHGLGIAEGRTEDVDAGPEQRAERRLLATRDDLHAGGSHAPEAGQRFVRFAEWADVAPQREERGRVSRRGRALRPGGRGVGQQVAGHGIGRDDAHTAIEGRCHGDGITLAPSKVARTSDPKALARARGECRAEVVRGGASQGIRDRASLRRHRSPGANDLQSRGASNGTHELPLRRLQPHNRPASCHARWYGARKVAAPIALVVCVAGINRRWLLNSPAPKIGERPMHARTDNDRCTTMRWLFLAQPGTNSRSILRDIMRGFELAGHEVLTLEVGEIWQACQRDPSNRLALMTLASEQLTQIVRRERIDATFGMWANGLTTYMHGTQNGTPATIFDLIGVPHVCYWLDAPHWAHSGAIQPYFRHPLVASPMLTHVINNEATAAEMRRVLGFGRTIALPYGVNTDLFRPVEGVREEFDLVASCGPGDPKPSEVALRELSASEPDYEAVRRDQAARLKVKLGNQAAGHTPELSEAMRELVGCLIDGQLRDRHSPMLERMDSILREGGDVGRAAQRLLADPRLYVSITMGVRRVEAMERAFTICLLAKRYHVATFGKHDLGAWACAATALGELAYDGMSAAYGRGRVGLNVMRWQDDSGINLKPLEIAASGVACASIGRTGLDRVLEPRSEVEVFDLPGDAATCVERLLADADHREAMAEQALDRVRREHTWTHRSHAIAEAIGRRERAAA